MKHYILLLLMLLACSTYGQSQENAIILEKMLNKSGIQEYFFPKLESRNPYYLLRNEFINKKVAITIDEIPVILIQKSNLKNSNYIRILRFVKEDNKAEVVFYYKIENIEVSCVLRKMNGEWQVKDYSIIQF